jgi:hypothetical protein
MFTIRHRVILTSSHKNIKFAGPDTQSQVNTQQDPLDTAKKLVKAIRESSFSKSTELQQLKELIQKAAIENATKKDEIIGLITNEIKKPTRTQAEWDNREYGNPTEGDKKDLQKVLDVWQSEYADAAKKLIAAKDNVKANTTANTAAAVPASAPAVSASGATKPDKMKAIRDYSTVVGRKEQADALGQILNVDAKNSNVIAALKDTDIGSVLGLVNTQPVSALQGYIDNNWNTSTDPYNAMRNLGYSSNGTF